MATGTLSPSPWFTGLDSSGNPLSGGLLYTYSAGTSTPAATYSDVGLTTPNANPIVLDASGRCVMFLAATSYKFELQTSAGVLVRTQDNVASVVASNSAIGSELMFFGGDSATPIIATSYPSGATFDKCHAGTAWFNIDSANIPAGTYVLEGMLLSVSSATVTAALVNLSDGSPDTAMVTIASTSSTGERQASSAITFASAGAAKTYAIKVKVSANSGRAWALRLVRSA